MSSAVQTLTQVNAEAEFLKIAEMSLKIHLSEKPLFFFANVLEECLKRYTFSSLVKTTTLAEWNLKRTGHVIVQ
jgi:hypothetical protein